MPVNWLKLLAVGVGAAVAALAGTINAALLQGAFPDDYNTQVLIIIYAMVILGGAGSLAGAVLGAFVVSVLMLEGLRPQTPIGDFTGNGRWVFYAAILVVLVAAIRPWRRLAAILRGSSRSASSCTRSWPSPPSAARMASQRRAGRVPGRRPAGLARPPLAGASRRDLRVGIAQLVQFALVGLIALVLCLTVVKGWVRDALIVPTVWLAGFVWETRLAQETSGPTPPPPRRSSSGS